MVVVPLALGSRPRRLGRALPRTDATVRRRLVGGTALVLAGAILVATVVVATASDAALVREQSRLTQIHSVAVTDLSTVSPSLSAITDEVAHVRSEIARLSAGLESTTGLIE